MNIEATNAQIDLLARFLSLTHGRNFDIHVSHEHNGLLVSWLNMHNLRQDYVLEIEPRFNGFQVKPESMDGLTVMVKMTI